MYGAVPNDETVHKRSAANIAVLRLTLITIIASNITSSAIFPFFPIIVQEKAGSDIIVGLIFASLPFMKAITALWIPTITQKFGRLTVLCFGLISASISLTSFGFVNNYKYWFFLRAMQGTSNALIDGPSMALLLAHSSDVAEDLGIVESAAGLSYVVGPAIGGAIYSYFGFQNAFLFLASGYIISLIAVPFAVWGLSSDMNTSATSSAPTSTSSTMLSIDEEQHQLNKKMKEGTCIEMTETQNILLSASTSTTSQLNISNQKDTSPTTTTVQSKDMDVANISPWRILASEPAVWIASMAGILVWTTVCFYDTYLSGQLKNTLALEARGRGLIYVWPALSYAGFSLYLGGICRKYGARNVLLYGCVGHVIVMFICGPSRMLTDMIESFGFMKHQNNDGSDKYENGREFAWVCVGIAMGMWGFCLAPLFQAGLPLMHGALRASGQLPAPNLTSPPSSSSSPSLNPTSKDGTTSKDGMVDTKGDGTPDEKKQRYDAIKTELIEDALSALQQSTSALGAVFGPVLGGIALEYLPQRYDPGCNPNEISTELGDNSSTTVDCKTGFAWTTTILAIFYILTSFAILTLPNRMSTLND